MALKKREPLFKEDNFMLYIPKRKIETFEVSKGTVKLLFYHNKWIEKFLRWLVKRPYISDVELDKLGSRVWLLIDGNNSVHEIGKIISQEFGESVDPVYDRLLMYLRYLNRRGWIVFNRGDQVIQSI